MLYGATLSWCYDEMALNEKPAGQYLRQLAHTTDELLRRNGQYLTRCNFIRAAEKVFIRLKDFHVLGCIIVKLLGDGAERVA